MQKGIYENMKPSLQLLLVFAIVGVSMIVMLILTFFTGINQSMLSITASDVSSIRYLQIIQSFAIFIIPPLIIAYLFSKKSLKWLGFERPEYFFLFIIPIILLIGCQPVISFLADVNNSIEFPQFLKSFENKLRLQEEMTNNLILKILTIKQPAIILLNAFIIVILPAFGEEMMFRGTLQPLLHKIFKNSHAAVLLTAFAFSFIHFQFMTFIPRFVLGAILGYLYLYGKNIWYPILGHLTNNMLSFITFYYQLYTRPDIIIDVPGEKFATGIIIASFVAIGFSMLVFRKICSLLNQ